MNGLDPKAQYPELIWDAMYKSGASQIHTHLQVSMGTNAYYGMMRRWLDASARYKTEYQRDFLEDFILIHKALGLVYEYRNVFVIVNIIPVKDQEIMIIADDTPEAIVNFGKMVHRVNRGIYILFKNASYL